MWWIWVVVVNEWFLISIYLYCMDFVALNA